MSYSTSFQTKLAQQPIKHRLRVSLFWLQRLQNHFRLSRLNHLLHRCDAHSIVRVPPSLQPPPYHYRGYQGPWIEDFFYEYWLKNQVKIHLSYLPIFFDGFFLYSQVHKYLPTQFERIWGEIQHILHNELEQNQPYFTILGMYDFPMWDWHKFPRNVLVFSAAGGGDIPIPLLKGSPPFQCPRKELLVSFMGSLDGASNRGNVRGRMYESLRDFAYFGQGSHWRQVMEKSTFTLCPRGQAPASFRLYEALSVGSIPIYIWDDLEWLPYQDILDWSEISISVQIDEIDRIPELVKAHSEVDIQQKQQRIEELYPKFFTLEGVCQNVVRMLNHFHTLENINRITSQRRY